MMDGVGDRMSGRLAGQGRSLTLCGTCLVLLHQVQGKNKSTCKNEGGLQKFHFEKRESLEKNWKNEILIRYQGNKLICFICM